MGWGLNFFVMVSSIVIYRQTMKSLILAQDER